MIAPARLRRDLSVDFLPGGAVTVTDGQNQKRFYPAGTVEANQYLDLLGPGIAQHVRASVWGAQGQPRALLVISDIDIEAKTINYDRGEVQ